MNDLATAARITFSTKIPRALLPTEEIAPFIIDQFRKKGRDGSASLCSTFDSRNDMTGMTLELGTPPDCETITLTPLDVQRLWPRMRPITDFIISAKKDKRGEWDDPFDIAEEKLEAFLGFSVEMHYHPAFVTPLLPLELALRYAIIYACARGGEVHFVPYEDIDDRRSRDTYADSRDLLTLHFSIVTEDGASGRMNSVSEHFATYLPPDEEECKPEEDESPNSELTKT